MSSEAASTPSIQASVRQSAAALQSFAKRRGRLLAYVLPALIAALVVQLWFRQGAFIAGGDSPPFIRDYVVAEGNSMWGHDSAGAGGPTNLIVTAPEAATIGIARTLGFSEVIAQRWFWTLVFAGAAAAIVFFTFAFTRRPLYAGAAGFLGLYNAFTLQNHNHFDMWFIATLGVTGGLILRAARGDRISPLWLGAAGFLLVYIAANPPRLAVALVWIVLLAAAGSILMGRGGTKRAGLYLLKASVPAVLFNLWWLVPYANSLLAPVGRTLSTPTDVQQWGWTHARASVTNVLSISSNWGWSFPQYYPYAASVDQAWWSPLRFVLPSMALAAPLVVGKVKRLPVLALAMFALMLAFLTKGIHPPLSTVNLFLYHHLPGLWLLREPESKLGPLLVLLYSALAALTVAAFMDRRKQSGVRLRVLGPTIGAALFVSAVAYPFPLWTGGVAQDNPPSHSVHATVPQEWWAIADRVNSSPRVGKFLLLPLDDYYQVPTTWGYYGVDAIPRELLKVPTVQFLPGGYFSPGSGFTALIQSIQTALLSGDVRAVPPLLKAAGISYVMLRRDLNTSWPGRHLIDPNLMSPTLMKVPGLRLVRRYFVGDLYEVRDVHRGVVQTYPSVLRPEPSRALSKVPSPLSGLPSGQAVGTPAAAAKTTSALQEIGIRDGVGEFRIRAPGVYVIARSLAQPPVEWVTAVSAGNRSSLSLRPAWTLRIDGRSVQGDSIHIPLANAPFAVATDTAVSRLDRPRPLLISPGSRLTAFASSGPTTRFGFSPSKVGDCARSDNRSLRDLGISAMSIPGGMRLEARAHSACVASEHTPVSPGRAYEVHLEYRTVAGSAARVCLIRLGLNDCATLPATASSSLWRTLDGYVVAPPGIHEMSLFLYADQPGRGGTTVTEYRTAWVRALRSVWAGTLPAASLPDLRDRFLPGAHEVRLVSTLPTRLERFYPVGDCARSDNRTLAQVGISSRALPSEPQPAVRLTAREHSACVQARVNPLLPGAAYTISFQARSPTGGQPRFCLYELGPADCANRSQPARGLTWQHYQETFQTNPRSNGIRLFLYADGTGGETTVEYREIHISLAPPYSLSVRPDAAAGQSPVVTFVKSGANHYEGLAQAATKPFILAFSDTFSPSWILHVVPAGRVGRHFELNGYANGWLIGPGPAFRFELRYGADVWLHRAQVVSVLSLFAVLLFAGWRRSRLNGIVRRDRRKERQQHAPGSTAERP